MNSYKRVLKIAFILILMNLINVSAQNNFKTDKIQSKNSDIEITFIGHGSLSLSYKGKNIQVDPYSELANYEMFPKADIILITHHHGDHLDFAAIDKVSSDKTQYILTKKCKELADTLKNTTVLQNGESKEILGIKVMAVPAYNIVHKRENGNVFHPKGEGNGYVLNLGGIRIYIAGDTENIPEMVNLENIDVAFLPMNLPYTMTPEMVALAARMFKPKILYPYHTGNTEIQKLLDLLVDEKEIEVRIREMN